MTDVQNAQPSLINHHSTTPNQANGDHDSGVDESTEGRDVVEESPKKPVSLAKGPSSAKGAAVASSPAKKALSPSAAVASPAKTHKAPSSTSSKGSATSTPPVSEKKLPMNKIVVGTSPSPNLKVVKSKIGSFENVKHKAGGGQVKLETKKIDLSNVKSRVGSTDNIQHKATGGERKIASRKLEWKAQSKIGSLDNATHKAGGGNKKIEVQKVEFKEKAKPKVGSKDNIQHKPGGGEIKIEEHKLEFKDKAKSKVGSMDYVQYKPGGGNVQIFDEKTYYKQQESSSSKKNSLTNSDEHISNQSPSPNLATEQPTSPSPAGTTVQEKALPQTNGDQPAKPAVPATVEKDAESKIPAAAVPPKEASKAAENAATSNGTSVDPALTSAAVAAGQQ